MSLPTCLIDTNVVSYVYRNSPVAAPYVKALEQYRGALSTIVVGELLLGAARAGWGDDRRKYLETLISQQLIIEVDITVARQYAKVESQLLAIGRPIGYADAWIAATALAYDIPLMTNNRRHFELIPGLQVISFS